MHVKASFEAFATPTLVQFAVPLFVAAILTAPWPALWQAGVAVGLVGLGGVALIVLAGNPVLALFVIGGVTVALLFMGIRNAWDSITYLAIERSQAGKKGQE